MGDRSIKAFAVFSLAGDFNAMREAEHALFRRGFSVGRNQGPAPRGILFGDFDIQKWRNLNSQERAALQGVMTGDMRGGPVKVEFFETAPDAACDAFMRDALRGTSDAERAAEDRREERPNG